MKTIAQIPFYAIIVACIAVLLAEGDNVSELFALKGCAVLVLILSGWACKAISESDLVK